MRGSYLLLLDSSGGSLKIGALGTFQLPKGKLAYVGSARGPGGLLARIRRHFKRGKPLRWHIDYLTESDFIRVEGALAIPSVTESELVGILMEFGEPLIIGFGCSDSKHDVSHLFKLKDPGELRKFLTERYPVYELRGARDP